MNDYSWAMAAKELTDGRIAAVWPLFFGRARMGVGPADKPVFDDEW